MLLVLCSIVADSLATRAWPAVSPATNLQCIAVHSWVEQTSLGDRYFLYGSLINLDVAYPWNVIMRNTWALQLRHYACHHFEVCYWCCAEGVQRLENRFGLPFWVRTSRELRICIRSVLLPCTRAIARLVWRTVDLWGPLSTLSNRSHVCIRIFKLPSWFKKVMSLLKIIPRMACSCGAATQKYDNPRRLTMDKLTFKVFLVIQNVFDTNLTIYIHT